VDLVHLKAETFNLDRVWLDGISFAPLKAETFDLYRFRLLSDLVRVRKDKPWTFADFLLEIKLDATPPSAVHKRVHTTPSSVDTVGYDSPLIKGAGGHALCAEAAQSSSWSWSAQSVPQH